MIKFSNQVPSIYPSASRDFQYLGWLIDIVLNGVKHNIDDLYNLPAVSSNAKLIELLAMTLGFKLKRNYDKKQLAALVSIFPSILKYKGTVKAVTIAAEALIKASGASGNFDCFIEGAQLTVVLPEELVDTTLFMDLLEYILPAGMTCRIIRNTQAKKSLDDILVGYRDTVQFGQYKDLDWNNNNLSTGLSGLFNIDEANTEFAANFKQSENETLPILNAGLLSNTVIPVLSARTPSASDEELQYINMVDREGKVLISADKRVLLGKE